MITGFRVSPGRRAGGARHRAGPVHIGENPRRRPARRRVTGRKDILDLLDFAAAPAAGREKIGHHGTFNANPVSAAAGTAALGIIAEGGVCERASATAADLRAAWTEVLAQERLPWAVYGTYSGFHLFLNPKGREIAPERFDPYAVTLDE